MQIHRARAGQVEPDENVDELIAAIIAVAVADLRAGLGPGPVKTQRFETARRFLADAGLLEQVCRRCGLPEPPQPAPAVGRHS